MNPEALVASAGIPLGTFLYCVVAGLVPVVNAEIFLVAGAAPGPPHVRERDGRAPPVLRDLRARRDAPLPARALRRGGVRGTAHPLRRLRLAALGGALDRRRAAVDSGRGRGPCCFRAR